MENFELVIFVPVRTKWPNIIFSCFKTALQTTKVRNTRPNVAITSFALSKIMPRKKGKELLSQRYKDEIKLKEFRHWKKSAYKRNSKSLFGNLWTFMFHKKIFAPFLMLCDLILPEEVCCFCKQRKWGVLGHVATAKMLIFEPSFSAIRC